MIFMIFAPFDFVFWVNTQHRYEIGSGEPTKNSQDPENLVLMRIGVGTIK